MGVRVCSNVLCGALIAAWLNRLLETNEPTREEQKLTLRDRCGNNNSATTGTITHSPGPLRSVQTAEISEFTTQITKSSVAAIVCAPNPIPCKCKMQMQKNTGACYWLAWAVV